MDYSGKFINVMDAINNIAKGKGFKNGIDWICAFTDDFFAQARAAELSVKYNIPYIAAQHHKNGETSEFRLGIIVLGFLVVYPAKKRIIL